MTVAAPSSLRAMPIAPLAATLAVQTLATAALFSLPAIAPAVAASLHVNGELVGGFVATAYGTGIASALLSPGLIRRYGGVRATQAVLLAAIGMVLIAATGHLASLAVAAVVLGLGYGAAAPASTHLLVPQTPRSVFNMVMSLRQIGVPLGGVLGALILPPLALAIGWRFALLAELGPLLLLLVLMELPRRRWDTDRDPHAPVFGRTLLTPFALLRDPRIRRLSVASFVYSGMQLCFVAFMTVQLTTTGGFDLVSAGRMLAVYQVAGTVSRPIWGWVADKLLSPSRTLAMHGAGMAAAAIAAGQIAPAWPGWAVLAVAIAAGCTAGGYTGVAYADYAALGGSRRTEATGLGTAIMFAAVMLIPPSFGVAVTAVGGYAIPDIALAVLAAISAALLCRGP
ncbi:MAG TPA: MFS transporter [Acetobacteraceae bacterium]|jgi:MFS family permease|nr:MFS transporter [Acetobacteraceae bacterium]